MLHLLLLTLGLCWGGIALQAMQERRPSAREDGGVSGVSSSCGVQVACATAYKEPQREESKVKELETQIPNRGQNLH